MNDPSATVARDKVVDFHYELFDEDGALLESSRHGRPVAVLHGHGGALPGVEKALSGRSPGERFNVTLEVDDAYGPRRADWTQRVSRKHVAGAPKRLRPGMRVAIDTDQGMRPVTILKVGSSVVDVDLNHPMAGLRLRFDIEVVSLRDAEPEELAHGHAHGPGGHGH